MLSSSVPDAYTHCEALVREADKDRFLASLFAPAERRRHLFALYAFNVEIARVREVAREPLAGEIRLQWWRDALTGLRPHEADAHPVAAALLDTIATFGLTVEPFTELIEARSFDLYGDPMPSLDALHGYARKTSSALIELGAAILVGGSSAAIAEPARHAGIAYAVAGLLRAFPLHAARGQLYVPIEVLDRHGISVADIFAGRARPELCAALAEMRRHARRELDNFRDKAPMMPPSAAPAFLPLALVPPLLARLEARSGDPFALVELPQWRRQWTLWRASRGGLLSA